MKAVLRRRYGSVFAFEKAKGLPRTSVSDVLRGRKIERTEAAVLEELARAIPPPKGRSAAPGIQSDLSDSSTTFPEGDRVSAGGPLRRKISRGAT